MKSRKISKILMPILSGFCTAKAERILAYSWSGSDKKLRCWQSLCTMIFFASTFFASESAAGIYQLEFEGFLRPARFGTEEWAIGTEFAGSLTFDSDSPKLIDLRSDIFVYSFSDFRVTIGSSLFEGANTNQVIVNDGYAGTRPIEFVAQGYEVITSADGNHEANDIRMIFGEEYGTREIGILDALKRHNGVGGFFVPAFKSETRQIADRKLILEKPTLSCSTGCISPQPLERSLSDGNSAYHGRT